MERSVSIFIPAYNAARHLEGVVARIPDAIWPMLRSVWIINDGSTDDTGPVIDRLAAARDRVRAVHRGDNGGYGATVKEGLALCRDDACDIAVCLHADGQYPPESLPGMIRRMRHGYVDILQGSRIASGTALSGGMPLYKYIANRALTTLENMIFGLRMSDYHSGYLCYSSRALHTIPFTRFSDSFDFDLEVIAAARKRGLRVDEIAVPTRYADEVSHVHPFSYGIRVLGVVTRYCLGGYA